MPRNILIYAHITEFCESDGGTVAQYNLANVLDSLGQNVRICSNSGIPNNIFNKYYNNDFPIDDDAVVIYCEGTTGNPLNAKNVVRWMLSELGKNVPYDFVNTWGKNELVYYFNSETKFTANSELMGNVYKLLTSIYINPNIVSFNLNERHESCHAFRKMNWHINGVTYIHSADSFDVNRHFNQAQCIEIFNNFKYFISYDPCTFLTIMAPMCGCISIVYPMHGLNKQEWLQTTAASEYLNFNKLDNLYGIAYGNDQSEIQYAYSTLHLVKTQWDDILKFNIEKTIVPFINDIQNFEGMQNTIQNNFF